MGAKYLILLALAASAVAGPLSSSGPCARQCTETSKFQYKPGTTYFFDYENHAVTAMQDSHQEQSRLHMRARVEIQAISKCDLVMRLTNVILEHSDPRNEKVRFPVEELSDFSGSLERFGLRFSFQDGRIESVCPSESELRRDVNIKRGILSLFQMSADSLENTQKIEEIDVNGHCPTTYEPRGRGWNSLTVHRFKDLSKCTGRFSGHSVIQVDSILDTKSKPMVQGSQDCEQVFKHERLESVSCREEHAFNLFPRHTAKFAVTTLRQTMTFVKEEAASAPATEFSTLKMAMSYDHEAEHEERDRRLRRAQHILGDLCFSSKDDIKSNVPAKFTAFVYALRELQHPDIVNIYQHLDTICSDNTKAKSIFLDAVSMAGTAGTVRFVVERIRSGDMSQKDADLWVGTLAFISKPDLEVLLALKPLLDEKRTNAILPVSAVVHSFCQHHAECGMKKEVQQLVEKMSEFLGSKCNGDKEKVVLVLKALGNMGVSLGVEEELKTCAEDHNLAIEIRLAAIQAYRRFSCDVTRSPVMAIYANPQEDEEVRITAFLSIMRCPSQTTLAKIRTVQEYEKSVQVGSFVMSYMKNVLKKTPENDRVREIVTKLENMHRFDKDFRKTSRNYRTSFFLDYINTGASVDSNVIFHSTSKLPRSAMVGLTVDVFGSSINLLEVQLRSDGLEKIVDKIFGHGGYFNKGSSKTPWLSYPRRSDDSVSMDLKMFGNSLCYKMLGAGNAASETFSLMDLLVRMAKENEVELTESVLFLDTTLTMPIGSGMPLKLALNGSAVLNLKMSGKIDAKSLQNVDIRGKIRPSGAVQISALMSVDAGVACTGLKMEATMHSSTLLDGMVEVRNGKVFQARLNVPRQQYEVVDVQSRILLITKEGHREPKASIQTKKVHSICGGAATRAVLGMEVCGELQVPSVGGADSPPYPFNGPARLRVFLRKTDPKLTHYKAEAKWTEDKSGREVTAQHLVVSFNTPESRRDREVSAEFHLNKQDSTLAMKLKVPGKKLTVTGKRVMNKNEKRLSVAVNVNDQEKLSVAASMLTESIEGGVRYQPALEVRGPNSRLLNIRSSASLKNLKYSGEIAIEDLTENPIILNGEMSMGERNRYDVMATVDTYALFTKVKGQVTLRNGFTSKMNVQYRIEEGRKESFEVTGKVRDLSASGLTKYSGAASLVSSEAPELSTTVTWETQYTPGHVENSFDLTFGDGRIRKLHKISMSEILKYRGSLKDNTAEGTFRLTYPQRDWDLALQLNHKNDRETLLENVHLKYGHGREASGTVDLKMKTRPVALTGDVHVKYPGRDIRLQGDLTQNPNREYVSTFTAQWQRDKQVRAVATVRDSSTRQGRSYQAKAEISIPNSRPISLNSDIQMLPGRYVVSADGEFKRGSYGIKGELTKTSGSNGRALALFRTPKHVYTAQATIEKNGQILTGKVDVNVPEHRRITGTVEYSNGGKLKTGSADLMWDADHDQSKRVQINGELRMNADGSKGKIDFKSPVKTMSGSYIATFSGQPSNGVMSGNLRTEFEWDDSQKAVMDIGGNVALKRNRRQMNGEFKLTSPLPGYENVLLTVQHTGSLPEWNNKIALQLKKNKKFVFGSEGKFRSDGSGSVFDSNVRINTPFRGLESLSLREVFEKRPSEVVSSSSVQWGPGKVVELSVSGSTEGSSVHRAGVNFTSPFSLRDGSLTFTNTLSKNTVDTGVDVRWNSQNSLSLNFDGRNLKVGKKHTASAELKMTSTIPNYEKMSNKIEFNGEPKTVTLNNDFRWNNNKATVALKGESRNTQDKYDTEGKLEYFSNFKNFEKGHIKVTQLMDSKSLTYTWESSLPYDKNLNMKLQGNMPSYRELSTNLAVTSSFAEDLGYEISYKKDGNRLVGNGVAHYGQKKVSYDLSGTTEISSRSWNVDYRVNVNTPVRGMEDLKFSVKQSRQDMHLTTFVKASKNQKAIALNQDLKIDDVLNFQHSFKLETPFSATRTIEVNMQQSGKSGEYKHLTEATWGNKKKATLAAEYHDRSNNVEASLNTKLPFESLSKLDVDYKHEADGRSWKPKIVVQWNDNKKVSMQGSLKNNDRFMNVETNVAVDTTFPGYKTVQAAAKYDVTRPQKTAEVTYKWDGKEATIRGNAEANPNNGLFDVTATIPVGGFETMHLRGDYNWASDKNLVHLLTEFGNRKYTLTGKHERKSEETEVSLQLTTPHRGYERITAFGSYAKRNDELSSRASYQWGDSKEVAVKAEYKIESGKRSAQLTVTTPFVGYKNTALKLDFDLQNAKKIALVRLYWDESKTMELNGNFESDFSSFGNTKISFNSPFEHLKELSAEGSWTMKPDVYGASLEVILAPDMKITGRTEAKSGNFLLTFDTPFRPYRKVRITSKVDSRDKEASVTASAEWDGSNKADLSGHYKYSAKTIEGKVEVNIPLNGQKTYGADWSLTNDDFKLAEGKAEIRTPNGKYQANGLLRKNNDEEEITLELQGPKTKAKLNGRLLVKLPRSVEGNLKMDSNNPLLPSFSLKSSYKNEDWKKIELLADLNDAHHAIATYAKNGGVYRAKIAAESPLLTSKKVSATANVDLQNPEKLECTLTVEESASHVLTALKKCSETECEASLSFKSPLLRGQEMSLRTTYGRKHVRGKTVALYNRKEHSVEYSYNRRERDVEAQLNAKSDVLPYGIFVLEGKASMPTDRSLETSVIARTGSARHSLTANGKIEDKHMEFAAALDSPALPPVSLTASLNNEDFKNIEASAVLKIPAGDCRARFVCKRDGWKSLRSTVELNLPVEGLSTMRAEATMKNTEPNKVEGSLEIQTSLKSVPKASVTGKASTSDDTWDAALNFKLPIPEYENVSVLATYHPKPEMTRITIALPNRNLYLPENKVVAY